MFVWKRPKIKEKEAGDGIRNDKPLDITYKTLPL